jgi:hypothetical protein
MNRLLLLLACLAVGLMIGFVGQALWGGQWWFIAVPVVVAGGWLRVGTPDKCSSSHGGRDEHAA